MEIQEIYDALYEINQVYGAEIASVEFSFENGRTVVSACTEGEVHETFGDVSFALAYLMKNAEEYLDR